MKITGKLAGVAAAAALAVGMPGAALAAPVINFDGENGNFGNDDVNGAFSDDYGFDVDMAGTLAGTITVVFLGGANSITLDSVTLNGAAFNLFAVGNDLFGNIVVGAGPNPQMLNVSGTANTPSASYSGTLAFVPVPEPATWAMMIFGFGLAGFALRTRRRKVTTTVSYA